GPARPRPAVPGTAGGGRGPGDPRRPRRPRGPRAVRALLGLPLRPGTAHWVVLGCGSFLLVFGLVMVLSASSVESYAATGSPFGTATRQAVFAGVGVVAAVAAARLPVRWWRRLAWPVLLLAVGLQAAVFTPLGFEFQGNRSWLDVGVLTFQPAELAKLALVLWVAHVLALKERLLHRPGHVLVPLVPGAVIVLGLVLAGHDVGTGLVLMVMLAAMVVAAGVRWRHIAAAAVAGAAVLAYFLFSATYRVDRVEAWLSGECGDYYGMCWQLVHGEWALASGGWWGVGLGAGRVKWAWLPQASDDFIFAVIGEELGLPGTLTVLALFAGLAVGAIGVARATGDRFVAVATAGIVGWVVGQALLNIGVVLGMLPVTGVPLPLVSSGGSSLVTTMVAIGVLVSFGRAARARRPVAGAAP
ncbi:MAG: FtsW/RodA/SpoVE family cell cycle protein, partial [Kineosporiaceae bacterium]